MTVSRLAMRDVENGCHLTHIQRGEGSFFFFPFWFLFLFLFSFSFSFSFSPLLKFNEYMSNNSNERTILSFELS